jgi:hypothetical protein
MIYNIVLLKNFVNKSEDLEPLRRRMSECWLLVLTPEPEEAAAACTSSGHGQSDLLHVSK